MTRPTPAALLVAALVSASWGCPAQPEPTPPPPQAESQPAAPTEPTEPTEPASEPGPAAQPAAPEPAAAPEPPAAPQPPASPAPAAEPASGPPQDLVGWRRRLRVGTPLAELRSLLASSRDPLAQLTWVGPEEVETKLRGRALGGQLAAQVRQALPPAPRYAVVLDQGYPSTADWLLLVLAEDAQGRQTLAFRAVEHWGDRGFHPSSITPDE